ncbi:DNA cytosine methyltransferase [Candidatus Binatus sp.]|uniref:DNA cytosine methyltransferase n=1 Tax=Candidatus Binatus sp. TaxID=2811406 RepID=UPI003C759F84
MTTSRNAQLGPRCIDLFAGAGGLAEGFRQAGWNIIAAVDNDPSAVATFRMNFPRTKFFEKDIRNVSPPMLMRAAGVKCGELECLLGGPPCQSFSYNNHARTASSQRARLFRQYLRIVKKILPQTIVMENVPGMLTVGDGAIVRAIRRGLEKLGYEVGIRILFAEDFGVPQERRRVFIVATRLGWEETLFPRGSHGPSPKPSANANPLVHHWKPCHGKKAKKPVTVWDAIGDLPRAANGASSGKRRYRTRAQNDFQRAARRGSRAVYDQTVYRLTPRTLKRIEAVPEGGNWRDIPRRMLPAGMKRARKCDHTKRYGRLRRRGFCCTILTKCDPHWGSYIHPTQDRTISVREAARLQSFPDTFRFIGCISKQYEQIGNAVPPAMARAVATALDDHLRRNKDHLAAAA